MHASTTSDRAAAGQRSYLPLLLLLFVGSGCAALVYEIVWYQMLQLVIGLTTVSLGVLLGTFMGGMCIGSLLLPRLIGKAFHPLRVYAVLELGIGAVGLVVLTLMPALAEYYSQHFSYSFGGMLLRIMIAVACLLPPTILMGATLPAIARWVEATPRGVSWLGFFYGGNIAGAVAGCLMAGFWLLRLHDTAYATFVAAGINAAVALLAIGISFFAPALVLDETEAPAETPAEIAARTPGSRAAYLAIAISGCTALGAEVVWTRLLSLTLGGTVYTFSIILAVFLAGLGIGSTAGAYVAREARRPALALAVCQFLVMLAIGWTAYAVVYSLPHWPIDPSLSLSPKYVFQLDIARALWAMLPAAICWGASFPLALAAAADRRGDTAQLVGGVYAANTVGAIVGALGFSLVLVPMLGSETSQRILIGMAAAGALTMLLPMIIAPRRESDVLGAPSGASVQIGSVAATVASVALAGWLMSSVAPAPWGLIAYGRYMATYKDQLVPGIAGDPKAITFAKDSIHCIYEGEGVNGSVAVTDSSYGVRSFHAAGKVQASNDPLDMKLQRMLGHISALAVKNPKRVLVVACGAGVTAGTFVLHPTVEEIYICDINDLVPKHVTPLFSKENYGITDQYLKTKPGEPMMVNGKKVYVIEDDGRHFIRTSKMKFDIISSDPIDPWVKGCAALNTVEYYQFCKDHLNPGGVMSLWIPLYEGNVQTSKSVISTFFEVFDKGIIWSNDDNGQGYDAVLFGQAEGSHFDVDALQKQLDETPAVAQSLAEVGFRSAEDLLATYAGTAPEMKAWMADAEINRDKDLRLQYIAGMNLNSFVSEEILDDILKHRTWPEGMFTGSEPVISRLKSILQPKP